MSVEYLDLRAPALELLRDFEKIPGVLPCNGDGYPSESGRYSTHEEESTITLPDGGKMCIQYTPTSGEHLINKEAAAFLLSTNDEQRKMETKHRKRVVKR